MQTPRLARRLVFRRAAALAPAVAAACGLPTETIGTRRAEPARSALPPASLEVWLGGQNADGDRVLGEQIVPPFASRFPQVGVRTVSTGPMPQHVAKVAIAAASGSLPDVATQGGGNVIFTAQRGLAIPLDDRLQQWGVRDDFYPAALGQCTWQGKVQGLPYKLATWTYVWRRDLLSEAGIGRVPETWEDALDAVRRLTRVDGETVLRRGQAFDTAPGSLRFEFFQAMRSLDTPVIQQGKAVLNGPEGLVAAQFIADPRLAVAPPGTTPPASTGNDLGLGLAGGLWTQPSGIRQVKTHTPDQYPQLAIGRPPVPGGQRYRAPGARSARPAALGVPDWLFVSAASAYPDQAWEFLKHFLAPAHMTAYNEPTFTLVTRKSAAHLGFMAEEKVKVLTDNFARFGRPQFKLVDVNRMNPALDGALAAISQGKVPAREGLDAAAREWDQAMREAGFTGDSD